jgi:hypothetical protein
MIGLLWTNVTGRATGVSRDREGNAVTIAAVSRGRQARGWARAYTACRAVLLTSV